MKIKPSNPSEWNRVNGDLTYRINYNDLNQSSIVVDLGARHGNWSDLIKNKYNPKIYCFEIVNEFCNQLMDKGYNTFCMAVSDKKEKIPIGIVDSEASIFNDNNDFEVDSIPASDIFKIINEDKIDLMKINVEGAEYPILKNLIETEEIKKIKNIQVQFHLFDGDMNNDYETISNELSKTHNITWRFPFVWENWELK